MSKSNLEYVSVLCEKSVVGDGIIDVPADMKVAGIVKMNIRSAGKVVITESGMVHGSVFAEHIHVSGKVTGNVVASKNLIIYRSGVIEGKVATLMLKMEEGGVCNSVMAVGSSAMKKVQWSVNDPLPASINGSRIALNNRPDTFARNTNTPLPREETPARTAPGVSRVSVHPGSPASPSQTNQHVATADTNSTKNGSKAHESHEAPETPKEQPVGTESETRQKVSSETGPVNRFW